MPAVLQQFLQRFRAKAEVPIINDGAGNLPSIRVHGSLYGGMPAANWTAAAYDQLAQNGYQRNSDVYSCVSLVALAARQVRWWDGGGNSKSTVDVLAKSVGIDPAHYRQSVDGGESKLRIEMNPRASIGLLTRAGGATFIEQWVSYLLLSGNSYIEIVRPNERAQPSMLYLDNPALVTANVNNNAQHEDALIDSWVVRNGYGTMRRTLMPWRVKGDKLSGEGDIVQSKLFNPVYSPYGMPPLAAAMMRVDMQNEGQTLLKRVLQRGFVPGWIEARENSDWTDEQVVRLKENVRRSKYHGEELFLENAVWHQMGFQPQDSGLAEQQILTKRDIASVFHVPAQLIGDTTSQTYSNFKEARRALYMEAVIPLLTQFRDDWNRSIGFELKSPLDFDRDSFDAITAAREEATDRVHKLWTSGLITRDEARADLEYEPAETDDVFYGPANFVPMDAEPVEPQD